MNSPAPGWLPDPTSRHQYRYWDGARWTDDVADGGVASTDALHQGPGAAADPNPTASDATQRVDPTRQYPVAGQQAPTSTPYYGDQYGTGQDAGAGQEAPPEALIAALAVLAVALIGGLVYFLVRDDDDGSSDNATRSATKTRRPPRARIRTTATTGTAVASDGGGGDTTLPDDIDGENVDELVELMADNMAQASNGALPTRRRRASPRACSTSWDWSGSSTSASPPRTPSPTPS